jgi:hypothetical protein
VKRYFPPDSDNEQENEAPAGEPEAPLPERFKFEERVDSVHNLAILERAAQLIFKEQQASQSVGGKC